MRYLLCGINARYIHSNLAVFCLKAYAQMYGAPDAEFVIKEYTINHYVEDILADLYEARADVLIFSCYIWNVSYVRELAEEMKKLCPHIPIWVGGPEVSYDAENFLRDNPAVDLVMQGEGEEQLAALTMLWGQQARSGALAGSLPRGVALYRSEGIYNTGFAPPIDMNQIPFIYEDFQLFEHKIIYYESSRGCPFRCSYCLSSVDKAVRFRSLSYVLPELQHFLDAEVSQVKFVDRTFNCNKTHAMSIWKYIHQHDNGITNFHFEIYADLLGEEEMDLFRKVRPGLIQLEIGVQSTNGPTIEAIRRHMNLAVLFANVDKVHGMGNIHQHLDLIAGLPYESYGRFKKSFNELYAHLPDQLQLGFLKVLKGTYIKEKQMEYGIVHRSLPPYEVLKTNWLTYDEVIRLKEVEEMVETYYNSMQYIWTLQYVIPSFASAFDFYEALAGWYRKNEYHKMNHSRMEKYEILRNFLLQYKAKCGQQKDSGENWELLDEMLLLDMYLRENVKSRPVWASDQSVYKKEWKQMFREKGETLFPALRKKGGYDSKKAAKHSHLEWFSFDVDLWMEKSRLERRKCLCLFDYGSRDPLNHNVVVRVQVKE